MVDAGGRSRVVGRQRVPLEVGGSRSAAAEPGGVVHGEGEVLGAGQGLAHLLHRVEAVSAHGGV